MVRSFSFSDRSLVSRPLDSAPEDCEEEFDALGADDEAGVGAAEAARIGAGAAATGAGGAATGAGADDAGNAVAITVGVAGTEGVDEI